MYHSNLLKIWLSALMFIWGIGILSAATNNIIKQGFDDEYEEAFELDTPHALEASDVTESSFTANWTAVEDASGYILMVYIKLDPNGDSRAAAVSSTRLFQDLNASMKSGAMDDIEEIPGSPFLETGTSKTLHDLTPNTQYFYVVIAYGDNGTSEESNEVKVITTSGEAAYPTLVVEEISYDFNITIGETASKTLDVIAEDLPVVMDVSLTGSDKAMFSYSLAPDFHYKTGGDITVSYIPTEIGNHSATLTLSSGSAHSTYMFNGVATPESNEPPRDGSEENPYTVADVFQLNNSTGTTKYWVKGYIVGTPLGGRDGYLNLMEFEDFKVNTALVLADKPYEQNMTKMIPVQLPAGTVRNELNLKDNPINLKQEVHVYGSLEAYFLVPGVKSITDYKLPNSDPNVNVEAVEDASVVYTDNRHIIIVAQPGTAVEIYTALGQILHSLITSSDITSIPVNNQGVLIVKVGERVIKL